jgi:redox-sensitive bicupin YhaK (pirin superfamily)
MLEGTMAHRDHLGNEGLLVSGGVQWMTAGRGVLHSEMPQQDEGRLHGFQLWVNLPAAEKMNEPAYREYGPDQIPAVEIGNGTRIKVIAGALEADGKSVTGPVANVTTRPDYFDVELAAGETLDLPTNPDKRVLLYVYRGALEIDGRPLKQQQLGLLTDGDRLSLVASEDSAFLFLAGAPIAEPIANWGPFVMNTQEEIEQAIQDYQQGRLV